MPKRMKNAMMNLARACLAIRWMTRRPEETPEAFLGRARCLAAACRKAEVRA